MALGKVLLFACCLLLEISAESWHKFGHLEYGIFSQESKNFTQSVAACEENGATLVKINSSSIQQFLVQFTVTNHAYFIGLNRIGSTTLFRWLDGTTLSWPPWGNRRSLQCVVLVNYHWLRHPCDSDTLAYICEREIDGAKSMASKAQATEGKMFSTAAAPTTSFQAAGNSSSETQDNYNPTYSNKQQYNLVVINLLSILLFISLATNVAFLLHRRMSQQGIPHEVLETNYETPMTSRLSHGHFYMNTISGRRTLYDERDYVTPNPAPPAGESDVTAQDEYVDYRPPPDAPVCVFGGQRRMGR